LEKNYSVIYKFLKITKLPLCSFIISPYNVIFLSMETYIRRKTNGKSYEKL